MNIENKIIKNKNITNSIINRCSIISQCNLDSYDPQAINKYIFESYGFRNENSKDISIKLLMHAEKFIKKYEAIDKLLCVLYDIERVIEIEKGIFEYSLLHIITYNLENKMVAPTYNDKVYDIVHNLQNNKALTKSILNNTTPPYAVAFLSPQQLNPSKWMDILNKKKFRENAENNMATSDRYRCSKCGERKAKVTELQIRGADEPTNMFVTCLVCYNTFIQ